MKRKNKYYVFLLILFISVGFAYLSTNLYTNGTSIIKGTRWSIYFDNIDNENSTYQINNNATISEDKKSVDFEVTFEKPGDEYYFYVDVVNAGNLDAMLDSYEVTGLTADQKKYLEWNVTYADGIELKKYDLLSKESTDTLRVGITFIEDVNYDDLPQESDISVSVKFKANYVQADSGFAKSRDNGTYNIRYQLDGGTITNNPTTYTTLDTITIPNPTKEGYTFAGWTVGKNLLNYSSAKSSYGITVTKNSDGSLTFNGIAQKSYIYFIEPQDLDDLLVNGINYTLSESYYLYKIYPQINIENLNTGSTKHAYPNQTKSTQVTFTANTRENYYYATLQTTHVDYWDDTEFTGTSNFQLEEGDRVTDFEPYISTPTKDIVIPKGSNGHRTYVANWVAN